MQELHKKIKKNARALAYVKKSTIFAADFEN